MISVFPSTSSVCWNNWFWYCCKEKAQQACHFTASVCNKGLKSEVCTEAVLWGPHSSLTGEGLCVIVQSGEEARRNKLSIKYIYSNLTPSNLKTCGLTVYKELRPTRDSDRLAKETQGKCQGNSATCHLPGESYELSLVILIRQQAWENPVGWNSPEDMRLG